MWKLVHLGQVPQPNAPWRPYVLRVHCVVTEKWMKARVPYAYFWHGDKSYGVPEVEFGVIRKNNPQPSGPRIPPGLPVPGMSEEELDMDDEDEDYAGL